MKQIKVCNILLHSPVCSQFWRPVNYTEWEELEGAVQLYFEGLKNLLVKNQNDTNLLDLALRGSRKHIAERQRTHKTEEIKYIIA